MKDYFRPALPDSGPSRYPPIALAFLLATLLVTACIYWHGLSGNFIFDDFQTLESLGDFNGVHNWETFLLYMQSGHAGPTGRPIAMLSFLLNAQDWPASPYFFKLTNLALHLACGLALNLLTFRLLLVAFPQRPVKDLALIALLTSTWWLLNPLHVSTTLYVVQRMTQLATLFTLLGMICYLHGRNLLATSLTRGYTWMTLGVVGMGALATLSKENGAILPLLLWLTEYILLGPNLRVQPVRAWKWIFLWLPSLAVIAYLTWIGYQSGGGIIPFRGFSITERLLTEARIVWQYLYHLLIPRMDSGNFYGDDIAISKTMFSSIATLSACVGIIIIVFFCWGMRKRYPLLAFAFLFFIAAHLIESTTVPLELYFEHRNYLPSLFLALPAASTSVQLLSRQVKFILVLFLSVIAIQAVSTWQRASLWGKTEELYIYWALQSPNSARAQTAAIGSYIRTGQHRLAFTIAQQAVTHNPRNLLLRLQWVSLIRLRTDNQPEVKTTVDTARTAQYEVQALAALQRMTEECERKPCNTIETAVMHKLLDSLRQNPNYHSNSGFLRLADHLDGRLYLVDGNIHAAMNSFWLVPHDSEYPDIGMLQTSLLASRGYYSEALQQLAWVKSTVVEYNLPTSKKKYYLREIGRLGSILREDLKHAALAKG